VIKLAIQNTKCIFAECALLLGAGFTKNFGGLLADEMWAEIFRHEKIKARSKIKTLMMNNFNYEDVYHSVHLLSEFTEDEKDAIKVATKSAYEYIDEILRAYVINHSHPRELYSVSNLISKIGAQCLIDHGNLKDTWMKSFIFTLRAYPKSQ
jgi:hypothetical protein